MRIAALLLAATTACSAQPGAELALGSLPEIPPMQPSIAGTITSVDGERVRVEERPSEPSGGKKALVRLTERTQLLRRDGSAATVADLVLGTRVSVWFVGPVMESYPVQATARAVVLEQPARPTDSAPPTP
ncbi:MAG TPA: DUF3221 domain-containing protein [Gemmatimonadaceae bacterium]|jgi:hypothetical protein|nr:DUF3221 domain-containing protein [Gemmatimonadaceae bacterium]